MSNETSEDRVVKTEDEWRRQLSPEQFAVTRQGGTEPAFTGEHWDTKNDGIYHCICCDTALFTSDHKFDSGSGWPSFFQPIDADVLILDEDRSHGMARTEVLCRRCDAHLGHVFPDGPHPTGDRYCMNSASLRLEG